MIPLLTSLLTCGKNLRCRLVAAGQLLLAALLPHFTVVCAQLIQVGEPTSLVTGRVHAREIGPADLHTYTLELAERQYARVLVRQRGSDVVVTFFGLRDDRTVVDRPNGARGLEAASFIAPRAGTYRLEIRMLEPAAPRGHYEIVLDQLRPSTHRDESRLAAEQAVTQGEILRAHKTASSLPQALDKFRQSIDLWRALDEPYETAVALYGRCLTHRLMGNNEQAIADCGESAAIMRSLGDDYGEAVARTGGGWSYIYLGNTTSALDNFSAALDARRRIGDRLGEPIDLLGTGWVYALRADYERAHDYFRQSLDALDSLGDPRGRAIRLAAIGEVYRRTGRPAQAVRYLADALRLARTPGADRGGEAETLTCLGWAQYALGEMSRAHTSFMEALSLRRSAGDQNGEAVTRLGLAHVERERGNLYNARLQVEAALTIIESLRAQVVSRPLRLAFFATVQDYYEFYIALLMHMHRLDAGRGFAADALAVSERARARSLLDLLNESGVEVRQGVPAELIERERSLRARLNAAASYQRQLLGEGHTTAQITTAAKDVADLSALLGDAEAQIRQVSPHYAALTQPPTLSVPEIQREVLDAETLLLEYSLGKERSFLWAVSPTAVNAYELPGGRVIEQAVEHAREMLTARNLILPAESSEQRLARIAEADRWYTASAARLSAMLLSPAASQLGKKRLLIVAPGALQLVPFGALPSPARASSSSAGDYAAPLIADHEVVSLPSASSLLLLHRQMAHRAPPTKLVSVIADPVFSARDERLAETSANSSALASSQRTAPFTGGDTERLHATLPRLFRTRWEAQQIASLAPPGSAGMYLDFDANRETIMSAEVGRSRILHIATHAIINDIHPELSGVALSAVDSDGRLRDGLLRAHDIYNLRLSADLVVLSSCRSALGKDFKGEGLVGLARGFMYAGATRVVGSLWSTDDKATAELMVRFYRRLLRENLRPPAALRAAQISMLRDRRWRQPYYWAGFTLQGEWQ